MLQHFPLPRKVYWLNTTDDGLHWAKTQMNTESWQPVGIPTTETFFGSSSNNCSGVNNAIFHSDNGGFGYSPELGYQPPNIDTLKPQAMAKSTCSLFCFFVSSGDGMWFLHRRWREVADHTIFAHRSNADSMFRRIRCGALPAIRSNGFRVRPLPIFISGPIPLHSDMHPAVTFRIPRSMSSDVIAPIALSWIA